jgi:hypothetical protein
MDDIACAEIINNNTYEHIDDVNDKHDIEIAYVANEHDDNNTSSFIYIESDNKKINEYAKSCVFSDNTFNGNITFELKENHIHMKAIQNNIKIYETCATIETIIGNVNTCELNVVYDMIYECATSHDNTKITIVELDENIVVDFNVFYGKNFYYNFQVKVLQKTATQNDLLNMMSTMQNNIAELQKEKNILDTKLQVMNIFMAEQKTLNEQLNEFKKQDDVSKAKQDTSKAEQNQDTSKAEQNQDTSKAEQDALEQEKNKDASKQEKNQDTPKAKK